MTNQLKDRMLYNMQLLRAAIDRVDYDETCRIYNKLMQQIVQIPDTIREQ